APAASYNIPLIKIWPKETSTQSYTNCSAELRSAPHYARLAKEMRNHVLGPMPVRDFMVSFLRYDDLGDDEGFWAGMPDAEHAFKDVPKSPAKEGLMYEPLAKALNADETTGKVSRCPGFVFGITGNRADTSGPLPNALGSTKPDISAYLQEHLEHIRKQAPTDDDASTKTHMGYVALYIEIKRDCSMDCFVDPPANGVPPQPPRSFINPECTQHLGQIVNYALEIVKRQHRRHVFSISLCGSKARFIRWDRAGAIVSRSFDIHDDPDSLCEFLWCFSAINQTDRGLDCTVQPGTLADAALFKQAIEAHLREQLVELLPGNKDVRGSLKYHLEEHYQENNVTRIPIPDPVHSDPRCRSQSYLLVSRPITVPHSLVGRGVRTYWAVLVEAATPEVVLLKDYWRYEPRDLQLEGDVLEHMARAGFGRDNVPTKKYHGDVPARSCLPFLCLCDNLLGKQTTVTQYYKHASWMDASIVPQKLETMVTMTHYRLITNEAGYNLMHLRGSQELLWAGRDALRAITRNFFNPRPEKGQHPRLHRNVSPGNIMLYRPTPDSPSNDKGLEIPPRTGYLINWDLS
ncbi:uncharacterized protein BXZ73DRAFT_26617, partial [Epithele typhae]|uniref:uncharacterized protein n=1 Tax=Epithele typhae TaxID=378194 RepID=UPI0020074FBB